MPVESTVSFASGLAVPIPTLPVLSKYKVLVGVPLSIAKGVKEFTPSKKEKLLLLPTCPIFHLITPPSEKY